MPNQPREGASIRTMLIGDEVWSEVKALAVKRGQSASEVVRTAIDEHLKRSRSVRR